MPAKGAATPVFADSDICFALKKWILGALHLFWGEVWPPLPGFKPGQATHDVPAYTVVPHGWRTRAISIRRLESSQKMERATD